MITRREIELRGQAMAEYDNEVARLFTGQLLHLHPDDQSVTPCIRRDAFWEAWVSTWVLNNVNEGDFFYDVGANAGYYTALALNAGCKVKSFEPNPEYFELLNKSFGTTDVTLVNLAMGKEPMFSILNVPDNLHGSASLEDIPGYDSVHIEIGVDMLDNWLDDNGRQVIKIDVEGYEEQVWAGMREWRQKPSSHEQLVLLEYTPSKYSEEFLPSLEQWGSIYWIDYEGNEQRVSHEWIKSQTDWQMLLVRRH